MNAMMSVLRRAGLEEKSARSANGAIHTYTIGFAAIEASRARQPAPGTQASDLRQQQAADAAEQFQQGLRYLLTGIGLGAARRREP